ncbi:hypothetical protein A2159_01060 [Candidatus Woesebacteria bacterium RBG_13_34_9]|uniref:Phosphoribosyltransferase domain-containing protein n=1 Tax=Candidatus Woesebacteria bacterium RBG_13_34_9 TaxID=1802477 RepID=A0A1F7X8K1_9BACT|nr:MAG: hypothetical protein A2159_01060 [Candidatus Woesebacteria bacterium RBG_13_34_9]
MDYYTLKIGKLERKLPIVSLGPKIKVASFNLLGDQELVHEIAKIMSKKIKGLDFDYLVGPEVKVVPLLHSLTQLLKKKRYIVCRKEIHGYMVSPIKTSYKPYLVIDGNDANLLKGKKVIVVDDVVTSGQTLNMVEELMNITNTKVVAKIAVFKQGEKLQVSQKDIIFFSTLPSFTS